MTEQEVQMRAAGLRGEQIPERDDGALMISQIHAYGRVERQVVVVVGIELQQLSDLRVRLRRGAPVDEHSHVVSSCRPVVRRESERGGQKLLRIAERSALMGDAPEQTQSLDVIA